MNCLKKIGLAIMAILIIIPVSAYAGGLGNARLSYLEGDVMVKSEDSSEWFPAALNMPLQEGDRIWVSDGSRAEIQTDHRTQVRLDQYTSVELLNIGADSAQFYLTEGSAYVNFRGGRRADLVQIDTPVSSLRAYERTAFGIDVSRRGDTDLSVFRGTVYAESGDGSTKVNAGSALEIGDDYADLLPLGRADDWERWNEERDRLYEERSYSSRHLPDELDAYSRDFDDNGRWVQYREYGYVWTPTVSISVGWSPYRNGRWAWIGNDYVWIGYEPWGWAPYHYGRWAYASSIGWFWVPPARGAAYWGPGYVGWVRTSDYVAWVPLAPRETYYGYGNYGPHSVNLINININTIVIKDRYRNSHVSGGYVAMHHDTFLRGRKDDFRMRENPFARERISVGRPDIKPVRETRMAVVKEIPKAKEPPQKIRDIRIRDIKEKRPLVKEREKSVFAPSRPERQMKIQSLDAPRERKRDKSGDIIRERRGKERRSDKPEPDIKGRTVVPPDQKKQEERGGRQEREGTTKKERDASQPASPQIDKSSQTPKPLQPERRPDQRKPEDVRPERPAKKEIKKQDEVQQPQPKMKQTEPVPNMAPQRDDRRQKQDESRPERPAKREIKPQEESKPPQPQMKQTEPVQKKDLQRDDRQQKQDLKQQEKQKEKDEKKEKRRKEREEKEGQGQPGAGTQQAPVR